MLKLVGFGPNFGLPDPSPFVVKVDCYMRMAGLEYELVEGFNRLRSAPKKKLPILDDGNETIADSEFIIAHLKRRHRADLDDWLTPEQAGTAHLVSRALDEGFYWLVVTSRWADDRNFAVLRQAFFGSMPWPLRAIVPAIVRRDVIRSLNAHGYGRHNPAEQLQLLDNTLGSLTALLGDKPYLIGEQPSSLDATAYGHLSCMISVEALQHPLIEKARSYAALVEYCERIRNNYYRE